MATITVAKQSGATTEREVLAAESGWAICTVGLKPEVDSHVAGAMAYHQQADGTWKRTEVSTVHYPKGDAWTLKRFERYCNLRAKSHPAHAEAGHLWNDTVRKFKLVSPNWSEELASMRIVRRPSESRMQAIMSETDHCECVGDCGCTVEPDGHCPQGWPSELLAFGMI